MKKNPNINDTFFDSWSSDMAYILGFITGDGYVGKNDCGTGILVVSINSKDEEILHFIKQKLCTKNAINITHYNHQQVSGKITPRSTLKITSNELIASLSKKGIVNKKTGKEKWPNPDKKYVYDYIRGFFDADGCIKNTGYISFTCQNKTFLKKMQQYINNSNIYKGHGQCWSLEITANKYVCELGSLMYKNATFFLKRKKQIFDNIKKPVYYQAFGEYKTLSEWFKDDRVKVSRTELMTRIKYSNLSFESCLTKEKTSCKELSYIYDNIDNYPHIIK